MARFLPSLRASKGLSAPATPDVPPADEFKTVLSSYYNALASRGLWAPHRAQPWPVERAVEEGYSRIVWVFKSIEAISASVARLPFQLKEDERTVEDHPLYRVLNRQANPMETGRQFRKRLTAQLLLSKAGAFVEVTRSRSGDIVRLDLLPPGRTRPVPGSGQTLVSHFELTHPDGAITQIPAENVRWFREPHPLDPYSGVTPLEAAGMSVELDFFARLYNVAFLKNDGRPAGVLGIDGEMDPDEMDRIEARFPGGPIEAGKLSVINGKVTFTDLAARPRDMQYEVLAAATKIEILTAFGVPESVIGYSADRTYSNAEQELYNFWTVTMPPILDLIASGFDEDSEDDLIGAFDVSGIEVLQRAEIARREEARLEFDKGLISPDEYRERAGYDRVDRPESRALYIASGKQPIPASDEDAEEMGLGPDALHPDPDQPPDEDLEEQTPPGGEPALTSPGASGEVAPVPPASTRRAAFPDAQQGKHLRALPGCAAPAPVMRLVRAREGKTAAAPTYHESDPDDHDRDRLETELRAALAEAAEHLLERAVARLESPKSRKGTRHWLADPALPTDTRIGVKALDASRIVDEERWQAAAEEAAHPLVQAAAASAAAGLLADLAATAPPATLRTRVADVVSGITGLIGWSLRRQAEQLAALVNAADQEGQPLTAIADAVRAHGRRLAAWASGTAAQAATATVSGAREAAAQALTDDDPLADVSRQWRTRRDEDVRRSHKDAHGQQQPVGSPFIVGDALLRFPGDPLGPPAQTFNCRCRLMYRSRTTGRFVPRPQSEAELVSEMAGAG